MTTPADDPAVEEAFEAYLAGRPVPGDAGDSIHAVTAFSEAVRASATGPGRPNAALAELLATGLLADQPSPSIRAARSAGSPSSRGASRIRRRRRFAMFFPALLTKILSAGAVAQAATGAGIVLVVATGAGATGVLGEDVQEAVSSVVGTTSEEPTEDVVAAEDETTEAEIEPTPVVETAAPAEPTEVQADPEAWIEKGPEGYSSFGAWVSASAHNTELRDWLRAEGRNFGSMVRDWAHKKGLDDADLAEEGVDLDESTDATPAPAPEVETETSEVGTGTGTATIERGGNRGNGKAGAEGNGGHGNGGQGNGGRGNGHGNSGKGNGRN